MRYMMRYMLFLCLMFIPQLGWTQPAISSKVSLNFRQTEVTIILEALAEHQKLNLIMLSESQQLITIKLTDIDWQTALDIILTRAKLTAVRENNLLYISAESTPPNDLELLKNQQLIQLYQAPLAYLTITLDHMDVIEIVNMIKQNGLLSERGTLIFDASSAKIMIHDVMSKFEMIKKLVSEFDKPQPQVQIQAHIVTMNDESLSTLGVNWGYRGHLAQTINQFDSELDVTQAAIKLGMTVANLAGNLLNLELSALEAENQVEIIASPSLLTTNLISASIRQGAEIPYEVTTGKNGTVSIEFKQAVLGLTVTPRVLSHGYIELNLQISQNAAGQAIKRAEGGEALTIDTQEIQTQVMVKRGQTLVLGGIFQQSKNHQQRQVPGLSKLPIIGGLFRYQQKKEQRRELVIFITPEIIEAHAE